MDAAARADALARLAAALGGDAVRTDTEDLAPHERPWRGAAGRAAAVVRPRDVAGVRAAVAWAVAEGITLVPQGANTGLVGAGVPDTSGTQVVLSLSRLDRVRELDPVDRVVIAEAGVPLDALDAALAPHGLELPVDLSAVPSVGGLVATNAGGARVLRHGDVRRLTLGLEVVLADAEATLVDELGALRKDNARPHLRELVVGSGGDLAIVTAAALEVVPRPRGRATALVRVDGMEQALALVVALERAHGPELSAVEWLDAATVGAIAAHVPGRGGALPAAPTLLVELATHLADRDVEAALAATLAEAAGGGLGDLVRDAAVVSAEVAWGVRHAASEAVAREAAATDARVVALDLAVRRGRLPRLLEGLDADLGTAAPDVGRRAFGHLGDGGVHLLLLVPGDSPPDRERALRDVVYRHLHALGGSISAEHGRGPTLAAWLDADASPTQRRLADALHELLDPHDVLGHGLHGPRGPEGRGRTRP